MATMARPKTYIIKLSDDERAALQKTIRNKKTCKTVLKRCQILLELDEEQGTGLTHSQIARSYWSYVKKKYKLNVTNFPFFCNC